MIYLLVGALLISSITSHDLGGVTTNCVNLALGIDSISNKIKENEINLYAYINFLCFVKYLNEE